MSKMSYNNVSRRVFACCLLALLFIYAPAPNRVFAAHANQEVLSENALYILVRDMESQPLSGAIVFIGDQNDQVSDAQGRLTYYLSPGTYNLQIYAADYLDHFIRVHMSDTEKTIEVKMEAARFWSTSPTNPPVGVGEANGVRLAAADGKLYYWIAFGGEAGTRTYGSRNDFYAYDPYSDSWTRLPDAPFSSSYGITTSYGKTPEGGDAIYIMRGYWTGQRTWMARYNLNSGSWEEGLNHQIPWQRDLGNQYGGGSGFQDYPRNGAVLVWGGDGFMYFFPGSGYGYEKYDWYRYDIAGNSWEPMPGLPHKQGPGNAAVYVRGEATGEDQDHIYVQFGVTPSGNYTHAEFWRYGMSSEMWEKLSDHDYGADDGSMLVWDGGNFIYHAPGAYQEQPWDKGMSQKRQFMRYSISRNAWTEMEKAPYNQWGGWDDAGGMARIENEIFAMKGGSDVAWAEDGSVSGGGSIPSNDFWKYTIADNDYDLLVVSPEGSGNVEPAVGAYTYPEGDRISLSADPSIGWHFDSWRVNGTLYSTENPVYLTINEDKHVQAVFNQPTNIRNKVDLTGFTAFYSNGMLYLSDLTVEGLLSLYDLNGRNILNKLVSDHNPESIPLQLPAGVYLLQMQHKQGLTSQKILIY